VRIRISHNFHILANFGKLLVCDDWLWQISVQYSKRWMMVAKKNQLKYFGLKSVFATFLRVQRHGELYCGSVKCWCAALPAGVQKRIPKFSWVSWIPSNQKICPNWKLMLSLHTFKPAEARTRRNLTIIGSGFFFFGRLMSLRQNILSAIKVMKGRVSTSKKDDEQQNDE